MNRPLIFGGIMSVLAAFLHIAIIIGGPEWYLFFGAGEKMATLAGQGSLIPTVSTLGIFTVLFIWGIYAFSGAGFIKRMPFLKPALLIISGIYLIRGLALFPVWIVKPEFVGSLHVWSSLVCLVIGFSYAMGTRRIWPDISAK